MIKKLIVSLVVGCMLLVVSSMPTKAQETDCVQVTQYGGAVGIVCGAKHETVDTGLADINPIVLASMFFGFAGASLIKAKKIARAQVSL